MKYNSIQEYFYKINNLLYALILFPLVILIVLYWQMLQGNIQGPFYDDDGMNQVLLFSAGAVVFSDWVISFVLFNSRLQPMRKVQSLGTRLDQYFSLTILRFIVILSGSVVLTVCFYLTESQEFSLVAVSNLLLTLLMWPLPSKVCRDLHLKGDERTLVLFKKDRLH